MDDDEKPRLGNKPPISSLEIGINAGNPSRKKGKEVKGA